MIKFTIINKVKLTAIIISMHGGLICLATLQYWGLYLVSF
jgi:hypothetical protein